MKGERIIKRFLTDQNHITIEDCDRLLALFGFEYRKSGGSHRAYHKRGEYPITIVTSKNSKYVKPGYVRMLAKRLGLEG
jgi:predicted RNA binding protein YcfA (HicA-like mRNA interferase family)